MKKFILQYKHAALWIVYGIFFLLGFFGLEHTVTTQYHIIHTAPDEWIPFCEWFIFPYLLWFPYMIGTVLYLLFTDKKGYYRNFAALSFGMTLFLIVSFLYPNGHQLRPEVMPRDNIGTWLTGLLYSIDTSTNILPSIHVYDSFMAHAAITHHPVTGKKKRIRAASFVVCISIILSTLFIKQHSVLDVATGAALAALVYVVLYRPHTSKRRF